MMNVSITIPQLFYDLIARVIPGFVFLLGLGFEFLGIRVAVIPKGLLSNSIVIILLAIAYFILSYLMGWVLVAFTCFSDERKEVTKTIPTKDGEISNKEKYYRIRIKNEAVGFRILKQRAEARMLESSRTGMIIVLLIGVSLLLLNMFDLLPMHGQSVFVWIVKLGIPLILSLAFWKVGKRA